MKYEAELELFRRLIKEHKEKPFGLFGLLFIKELAERLEKEGIISIEVRRGEIVCRAATGEVWKDE